MLCTLRGRGYMGSGGGVWELGVDVCVGVVEVGVVVAVVVVVAIFRASWGPPSLYVAVAFVALAALACFNTFSAAIPASTAPTRGFRTCPSVPTDAWGIIRVALCSPYCVWPPSSCGALWCLHLASAHISCPLSVAYARAVLFVVEPALLPCVLLFAVAA